VKRAGIDAGPLLPKPSVSVVGIILPTRLLVGMFAGPLKVAEPPLGVLLFERRAAAGTCGLLGLRGIDRRSGLGPVTRRNGVPVRLLVV
jgi:hypothetical protein